MQTILDLLQYSHMNKKFLLSLIDIIGLCILIAVVTFFLIDHNRWMGIALLGLGAFCLVTLLPFGIKLKAVLPDIFFGVIDNGILAVMAIFGGYLGGTTGAILGGLVGNAISDGVAGIFEGFVAERYTNQLTSGRRTMLTSAVGKMSGCLLGAGAVLFIAGFI